MVIHALLERALFSLQLRAQVTRLRPGDSGCSALSAGEEDTQWHLPCSAVQCCAEVGVRVPEVRGHSPVGFGFLPLSRLFGMRQKNLLELSPRAMVCLDPPPPALPASPGWYLSCCSAQAGVIFLRVPWAPLSYSPSQGALAPIQGASKVPSPILSWGLRTLSDDLVGVPWVFFKECYPQPFKQVLI